MEVLEGQQRLMIGTPRGFRTEGMVLPRSILLCKRLLHVQGSFPCGFFVPQQCPVQCCRPTTEDSYFTAKHAVHGPSHLSVDSKRVYINCEEEQGFLFGSLAYMEYIPQFE